MRDDKGVQRIKTYARSLSDEEPGCRETRRRDCASIWSKDKLTAGRSRRDRWAVRAREDSNNAERSVMVQTLEVNAVQLDEFIHWAFPLLHSHAFFSESDFKIRQV